MRLPDFDALLRRQIQLLALGHFEGRVPGVEIAHGLRAEAPGCVHIGEDCVAQRLVAVLSAPGLCKAQEEALVWCEPVQCLRLLALQRQLIRVVGGGQAGHVGDVLAQGELAVDRQILERFVAAELCGQRVAGGLELLQVLRRPPVVQLAMFVEPRPCCRSCG